MPKLFGKKKLHKKIAKEDIEAIKELLAAAADQVNKVNELGQTPLHIAAKNGPNKKSAIITDMLLKAGADLTIQNNQSRTAVHLAALYNNPDVIKVYFAHNPQSILLLGSEGKTPLVEAANANSISALKLLIEYCLALGKTGLNEISSLVDKTKDINVLTIIAEELNKEGHEDLLDLKNRLQAKIAKSKTNSSTALMT